MKLCWCGCMQVLHLFAGKCTGCRCVEYWEWKGSPEVPYVSEIYTPRNADRNEL